VDFPGLVAIVAFAATDTDDLFVLMIFYSSRSFPARQVTLGQFIGIGLLVAISILGSLIALVVPFYVIGLLGLVPVAIGIKNLIEVRDNDKTSSTQTVPKENKSYLAFLTVAAITISNGGDNIGVYVPLFSKYNTVDQITMLTSVLSQ
jgi:cadmium resistance protein CadD (predicted permease)